MVGTSNLGTWNGHPSAMSFSKSFGWRFLQPLRLRGSQIPRGPTEGPFQLAVLTMGEIWGDHMEMICGSNGDIVYVDVVYIWSNGNICGSYGNICGYSICNSKIGIWCKQYGHPNRYPCGFRSSDGYINPYGSRIGYGDQSSNNKRIHTSKIWLNCSSQSWNNYIRDRSTDQKNVSKA